MDAAGFERAHIVGNSLGGHVALQLAERGRAESVVALAPGGGWPVGHGSIDDTMDFFRQLMPLLPELVGRRGLHRLPPGGPAQRASGHRRELGAHPAGDRDRDPPRRSGCTRRRR